jgi:hypothetical protein
MGSYASKDLMSQDSDTCQKSCHERNERHYVQQWTWIQERQWQEDIHHSMHNNQWNQILDFDVANAEGESSENDCNMLPNAR